MSRTKEEAVRAWGGVKNMAPPHFATIRDYVKAETDKAVTAALYHHDPHVAAIMRGRAQVWQELHRVIQEAQEV